MGVIPRVDKPSPAFIHVDVDDLWAIAECYEFQAAGEWAHHVSADALPRFADLFREHNIAATFFIVGRDLEHPPYVKLMAQLLRQRHMAANHSYSHSLRFRALTASEMADEISATHLLVQDKLGVTPSGFRAPGYGWSRQLLAVLDQQGYSYDSSLMPGPYGGIFRWMDNRITNKHPHVNPSTHADPTAHFTPVPASAPATVATATKTQYPKFSDTWNSLYPVPVTGTRLVELPSATSGLLRLPFQAGICMRLGWPYFRACFEPFRRVPALPFVFLFHAADLADFSAVPYPLFRQSSFFNKPVRQRYQLASRFLAAIKESRPVITTEEWLSSSATTP